MPFPPRVQSNPRYKNFCQDFFTAGDEEQFEMSRDKSNAEEEKMVFFTDCKDMDDTVWDRYTDLSAEDVLHTFRYIFHKFKKGLYIRIKDNQLTTFLPFSKAKFKNEWGHLIKVHPSTDMKTFLKTICEAEGYRFDERKINFETDDWYANNCLLRYEFPISEGDTGIHHLKDMIQELCSSRLLPDIELFINRRDFPLLKRNLTEPYEHLFSSDSIPLLSHKYDKYIPILSSVGRDDFADIPIPTLEDWARVKALENVEFPKSPMAHFVHDFSTPFDERIPKAVFRGGSTGAGVTIETNPRLKVAFISAVEKPTDDDGSLLLDAGITSWNLRPRKNIHSEFLQTISVASLPFQAVSKLSPYEQSKFKYIINIDGHSSAFRLSMELNMGSVLLIVDSDYFLWFRKLLQPFVHYVPIKRDLSDLVEKVKWCKRHDDLCKEMVKNCKKVYNTFLTKDGILDYLQKIFIRLSQHFRYQYHPSPLVRQLSYQSSFLDSNQISLPKGPFSHVASTHLSTIHRANTLILKQTTDSRKKLENVHEAFIALKELNDLKSPHFAKVVGYNTEKSTVILDQCQGITLFQWLQSPEFQIKPLMSILGQVALALQVAQNKIAFVHQDLFPWNVILKTTTNPTEFEYPISHDTVIRFSTKIAPIIIDFGKAHIVSDNIHYGFVKMFEPDSIQDLFCLVISCLSILLKRGNKSYIKEMMFLANFFTKTSFHQEKISTFESLHKFVEKYCSFTNLISVDKKDLKNKHPIDFFKYLFPCKPINSSRKPVPLRKVSLRLPLPPLENKVFVYYFFQQLSASGLEQVFYDNLIATGWPVVSSFHFDHATMLSEELFQNKQKCSAILSTKKIDSFVFDIALALHSILSYKGVYEVSVEDRMICFEKYHSLLSIPLFFLKNTIADMRTVEFYIT